LDDAVQIGVGLVRRLTDGGDVMRERRQYYRNESRGEGNHDIWEEDEKGRDPTQACGLDFLV
jgi:hypothetical protein